MGTGETVCSINERDSVLVSSTGVRGVHGAETKAAEDQLDLLGTWVGIRSECEVRSYRR